MASRDPQLLHPTVRRLYDVFMAECAKAGVDVLTTCTFRSHEEQERLYAQGRTAPGRIVTNARGGQSDHNHMEGGRPAALAFDVVPIVDGKPCWDANNEAWAKIGAIGISIGLDWYGVPKAKFREFPHFCLRRKDKA